MLGVLRRFAWLIALSLLAGQTFAQTGGLAAKWVFEEGSGTAAADSSGNGNTGTLRNGVSWTTGQVGGAIQLNGSTQDVVVADSPSLSITGTGLTLAAWIFPTLAAKGAIIHKNGHYSVLRNANGSITYADSATWAYATIGNYGTTPLNTWSHVAVTFDGSAIRFYVNAQLVGTKTRSGTLTDNAHQLFLGSYSGTYRFGGKVDEAHIYNRALSAQEIADLQSGSVPNVAQIYYVHPDHLNTPRLITNSVGQGVWRWDNTDPFGNNAPNENPSSLGNFTCNLRFPGQYFDKETNLHYNYFRDYDPAIGRYIQSDPIGLKGGINTYAYIENNPLNDFDPLGLCRVEVRFKPTPVGGRLGIYHAYIVTTAPNGTQNYFRGGPTGRPTPSQPIWGNVTTRYGAYGPNTPDWDPGNPPSVVLRNDDQPCDCYDASFANTLNAINAAGISYIPLRRNSNSVVGTALGNAGFGQFTPPVTAPALWNNLNNWLGGQQ